MKPLAIALAAMALMSGCASTGAAQPAPTPGAIVDGFPLGGPANPPPDASDTQLAAEALEQRMPGHPAIASAAAFDENLALVDPSGVRSGRMTVYLFELSDGSYHAAGVYCGVGGCGPVPVYLH